MLHELHRYWKVWLITALNEVQATFISRWANVLFFTGKTVRFAMMIGFLLILKNNVPSVAGYTSSQMLVFYVTYQLIDTVLQIVYRGVYEFGTTVRDGSFDGVLIQPINALFKILTGKPDINDVIFIVPSMAISFYLLATSGLHITFDSTLLYLVLLINSFLIGTAIHIFIVSFTLLTTDVDNIIFMYRDVSRLGQFPVTLYFQFVKFALFFIIPIGIMVTIPAQLLLNTPPTYSIPLSFVIGLGFLWLSLRYWNHAMQSYTSAGG